MKILINIVLGFITGTAIYFGGKELILKYGYAQFERGANAVVVHHKYFGTYGSMLYRKAIFNSDSDPQTGSDIILLLEQYTANKVISLDRALYVEENIVGHGRLSQRSVAQCSAVRKERQMGKSIRDRYKELTGNECENSQGEPDVDYVSWLEEEIIAAHEKTVERG